MRWGQSSQITIFQKISIFRDFRRRGMVLTYNSGFRAYRKICNAFNNLKEVDINHQYCPGILRASQPRNLFKSGWGYDKDVNSERTPHGKMADSKDISAPPEMGTMFQ